MVQEYRIFRCPNRYRYTATIKIHPRIWRYFLQAELNSVSTNGDQIIIFLKIVTEIGGKPGRPYKLGLRPVKNKVYPIRDERYFFMIFSSTCSYICLPSMNKVRV